MKPIYLLTFILAVAAATPAGKGGNNQQSGPTESTATDDAEDASDATDDAEDASDATDDAEDASDDTSTDSSVSKMSFGRIIYSLKYFECVVNSANFKRTIIPFVKNVQYFDYICLPYHHTTSI